MVLVVLVVLVGPPVRVVYLLDKVALNPDRHLNLFHLLLRLIQVDLQVRCRVLPHRSHLDRRRVLLLRFSYLILTSSIQYS